jgi:hypothetical protein
MMYKELLSTSRARREQLQNAGLLSVRGKILVELEKKYCENLNH